MGNARMMADPRMAPGETTHVFDGKRMVYGGFATIPDEGPQAPAARGERT